MNTTSLEYAHKMWEHYAQFMRVHQRDTAKTYLWLNMAVIAGLKVCHPFGPLFPMTIFCAFCAVFAVLLGVATLSSMFWGKGAPDPIDKFKQLNSELITNENVLSSILYDYDKGISIIKRQTRIKGYLLRFQAGSTVLSIVSFFFIFL